MRVMCINPDIWVDDETMKPIKGPQYGDVDMVVSTFEKEYELLAGGTIVFTFYCLFKWPPYTEKNAYLSTLFIPIQDQETEVETLELELIHH